MTFTSHVIWIWKEADWEEKKIQPSNRHQRLCSLWQRPGATGWLPFFFLNGHSSCVRIMSCMTLLGLLAIYERPLIQRVAEANAVVQCTVCPHTQIAKILDFKFGHFLEKFRCFQNVWGLYLKFSMQKWSFLNTLLLPVLLCFSQFFSIFIREISKKGFWVQFTVSAPCFEHFAH